MAWSPEVAAVEWSRSLGLGTDATVAYLGEGAHVLPIVLLSALAWLSVQLLVVPVCRLAAPWYVQAVQDLAAAKAKAAGPSARGAAGPDAAARAALNDVGIRAVALVFSAVESYGALRLTFDPPPAFERDPHSASHPFAMFYCALAAGYFVWDLPICLYYRYGFGFIMHAALCLVVEIIALHPFNQVVMTFSHLFELSTPFLNMRLLMIACGRTKSLLFTVCELAFGLLFFAVRILYGYYKSWEFVSRVAFDLLSSSSDIATRKGPAFLPVAWCSIVLATALCGLNGFWFWRIASIAMGGGKHSKAD